VYSYLTLTRHHSQAPPLPIDHRTTALLPLFFFSSRRRHTRWPRDWSSDVCSSDLRAPDKPGTGVVFLTSIKGSKQKAAAQQAGRSEERRVGKECRSRWAV